MWTNLGGMPLWGLLGLTVGILIVWLALRAGAGMHGVPSASTEALLKRRYADGDPDQIDQDEYRKRLDDLGR